ncbi:NAD(P)-binding domain-containing protein [Natrinema caseinilyticum]|uniref:NAD(P)-binding domain-containing protein n=1 Tax=Natrinema caseinilyticum TaxID=2961570 RepID=UPI0020C43192|nr:NAD(P)-binding domain-containing protein [Natrinema caseinilyticum]
MSEPNATVGIVGYGEVGRAFASRLHEGGHDVVVLNRTPDDLRARLGADDPRVAASFVDLAAESDLVLSCVWPQTAAPVAENLATGLAETTYVDLNSIGPETTRMIDRTVTDAGGTFLKGAIMDSVAVNGADAPVSLAGPDVEAYATVLSDAGLSIRPFGTDVERPAALKMCRSMVTKGIMALFVETLLTAQRYELAEDVLESVDDSFDGTTPAAFARYFLVDMASNAARRRNELREVLATARDARVDAPMTEHTLAVHEEAADRPLDVETYTDMLAALESVFVPDATTTE